MSHKNGQVDWIKDKFCLPPSKPKGWVTVSDIVEITGNLRKTVSQRVRIMVESGDLEEMECMVKGKRCKCYRKKK